MLTRDESEVGGEGLSCYFALVFSANTVAALTLPFRAIRRPGVRRRARYPQNHPLISRRTPSTRLQQGARAKTCPMPTVFLTKAKCASHVPVPFHRAVVLCQQSLDRLLVASPQLAEPALSIVPYYQGPDYHSLPHDPKHLPESGK